jgi:hypothetical protein
LAVLAASACWILLTVTVSHAYASCGDWLEHSDRSATASKQNGDTLAAPGDITNHSPARPCNGPFCSRVPKQPAAPAPVDISSAPAKSALHVGLVTLAEYMRRTNIAGEIAARPAKGFPASIDHPPRA